jgi:hypothetical protein
MIFAVGKYLEGFEGVLFIVEKDGGSPSRMIFSQHAELFYPLLALH